MPHPESASVRAAPASEGKVPRIAPTLVTHQSKGGWARNCHPEMWVRTMTSNSASKKAVRDAAAAAGVSYTTAFREQEAGRRALVLPPPLTDPTSSDRFAELAAAGRYWIGVTDDGEDLVWDSGSAAHLIISGSAGRGKSTAVRAILTGALLDPTGTELVVWGEQAQELSWIKGFPNVTRHATWWESELSQRTDADRRQDVADAVEYVRSALSDRQEAMSRAGQPKWSGPRLLLIIDGLDRLIARPPALDATEQAKIDQIGQSLDFIARTGRSAAVHLVVVTQVPTAGQLPMGLRAQFSARMLFGPADRLTMERALHQQAAPIPPGAPSGWCTMVNLNTGQAVQGRGWWGAGSELRGNLRSALVHRNPAYRVLS